MWLAIKSAWFCWCNSFGAYRTVVKVDSALQTSNQICDAGAIALGNGLSANKSLLGLTLVSCCAAPARRFFYAALSTRR
jgi:hypothetical protein